jgi:hypothetical protein
MKGEQLVFSNVISFIQMLATINTPKVQAPFGVSLLHPVLIIQGYNQNYNPGNVGCLVLQLNIKHSKNDLRHCFRRPNCKNRKQVVCLRLILSEI